MGHFGGRPLNQDGTASTMSERFAEVLELSEFQSDAIQVIRDALREDVRILHEQAREDFKELLTADQLRILEEIEAEPEAAPM